jgi:hypothetical protein
MSPISFKTDTGTIIALLSKGFRATSPLRFARTRQKDVSNFDFFRELRVVHNRSEWWGSVDCVILKVGERFIFAQNSVDFEIGLKKLI